MAEPSRASEHLPVDSSGTLGALRIAATALSLLALLTAVAVVWATPRSLGDLYVGLAAGRDIVDGKLGQRDDWSFLSPDRIWINQNWLSHLAIYVSYAVAGHGGLLILKSLLVAALAAFLALIARRQGADWPLALLVAAALVAGSRSFIDLRPNLFGLVLAAGLLWTVSLSLRRPHWIWASVGVELVWSNAHGGFLFGIGVLGLWAVCRTVPQTRVLGIAVAARRCWPLLAAPVVSMVLAVAASPFGMENLTHPFTILGSEAFRTVLEWRSVFDTAGSFGTVWELWTLVGFLVTAPLVRLLKPDAPQRFLERALTALCISASVLAAAWWTGLAADVRSVSEIATFDARRSVTLMLFGALTATAGIAVAAARGRLRGRSDGLDLQRLGVFFFHALLAALTIAMAVRARRFIPLAMVMSCPLLAREAQVLPATLLALRTAVVQALSRIASRKKRQAVRPQILPEPSRARYLVALAASVALLVPLGGLARAHALHYRSDNPNFVAEDFAERMHYSRDVFPAGAAEFIVANGLEGRVYQDWTWEGYLHWTCPRLQLFVGDRAQQVYDESMLLKQDQLRKGRRALELLAEFRIPMAIVPLSIHYEPFLNATVWSREGRWAIIYCDGQAVVLVDATRPEQAHLVRKALSGQLRYPSPAAGAASKAYCMTSRVVAAPGEQTLAAIQAANDIDPIPHTYLLLARAPAASGEQQALVTGYFEREHRRLATIAHQRPGGRRALAAKMIVAEVLAMRTQAEGRSADAQALRDEIERIRGELEALDR